MCEGGLCLHQRLFSCLSTEVVQDANVADMHGVMLLDESLNYHATQESAKTVCLAEFTEPN